MKSILLTALLCFFGFTSIMAQDYSGLEKIELKTKEDCRANDNKALECAKFLLSTPDVEENLQCSFAILFLLRWMEATPDFGFTYERQVMDLFDKKSLLGGVYSAAIVKYSLENREKAKDAESVKLHSAEMFLNYCKNPDNKVKINKKMKKAIEALDSGKLAEFIK